MKSKKSTGRRVGATALGALAGIGVYFVLAAVGTT